jgi:CubicO group peptidase (beta-lactamase class C family)
LVAAFSVGLLGPSMNVRAGAAALGARVTPYLSALARAHYFSGAVLMSQRGAVLLDSGYGRSDWSSGSRFTPRTVFPIGVFDVTAAAVLQLEDAGRLHDGDSICRYIPGCPAAWQPITVLQLLNETSGLHDYFNNPTQGSVETRSFSLAGLVTYLKGAPTDQPPGNCCSFNADLPIEEYLVQSVSGEAFAMYLRQHILGPLHLAHTGYYPHRAPATADVRGSYGWQQPAADLEGYDFSSTGGVLFTTLPDLGRLEHALFSGRLLSATSTARLTSISYTFEPPSTQYDMTSEGTTAASGIVLSYHGHTAIEYGWGLGSLGLQTTILYLPDLDLLLIVVDNFPNGVPADAGMQLLMRIYGGNLSARALGAIGEVMLRPQSCAREATSAAPPNFIPAAITFDNQTAQAVSIYLLDQAGTRELYATLAPGVSYVQSTAQQTPFLVSTASGVCMAIFTAKGALNRAIIRPHSKART